MWTFPLLVVLLAAPPPEVRYEQLSCGLAVVLVEDQRLPLVAVESWFVLDEPVTEPHARQNLVEAARRRFQLAGGDQRLAAVGLRAGFEASSEAVRYHTLAPASLARTALDVELRRYSATPVDERFETRRGVLIVIGSFDSALVLEQAHAALAALERASRPTPAWRVPARDVPAVVRRLDGGGGEICFLAPPLGASRSARLVTLASLLAAGALDPDADSPVVFDWHYAAGRGEGRLCLTTPSLDALGDALRKVESNVITTLDLWRARRMAFDAWRRDRAGFAQWSGHLARSQALGDDLRVDAFAAGAIGGVRVDELRSAAAELRRELENAVEGGSEASGLTETRHIEPAGVPGDLPLDRLGSLRDAARRFSDFEPGAANPAFDLSEVAARRLAPHVWFLELNTLAEACIAARLPATAGNAGKIAANVRAVLADHARRQLGLIAALRGHAWEVREQGDHVLLSVVVSAGEAAAAAELLGRLVGELRESGYPTAEFLIVGRLSEDDARACAAWLGEADPRQALPIGDAPRAGMIDFRRNPIIDGRWRVELAAVDRRPSWLAEAPPWLVAITESDVADTDSEDHAGSDVEERVADSIVRAVRALDAMRRVEFSDAEKAVLGRVVTSQFLTSLEDARSICAALARGWERPWEMDVREAGRGLTEELRSARIVVSVNGEAEALERAVRKRLTGE